LLETVEQRAHLLLGHQRLDGSLGAGRWVIERPVIAHFQGRGLGFREAEAGEARAAWRLTEHSMEQAMPATARVY